jgi:hypothetical protein
LADIFWSVKQEYDSGGGPPKLGTICSKMWLALMGPRLAVGPVELGFYSIGMMQKCFRMEALSGK